MKHLVHESMSKNLITIQWDTPMREAYLQMKSNRIRHLLVMDQNQHLVGILSERDVLRSTQTSVQEEGGVRFLKSQFYTEDRVVDYMRWPVQVVSEDTSLLEVTNAMIERKISSFAVARDNQVVGIITHEDLLRLLRSYLEKGESHLTDKLKGMAYNSPIGRLLGILSDAGI